MPDEPDPPRKFYGLKPKEFERANELPAPPPLPESRADPGIARSNAGRIDVRDLARQAARGVPLLDGSNAPANRDNDIHSILRANLAHANAAGLNELAPKPKRRSRRKRDYWLAMLGGNLVFIGCTLIQPIFGGAGLILYNIGLAWTMWVVMDDY